VNDEPEEEVEYTGLEELEPDGLSLMEIAARVAGFKHVVNEPKWEVK
jgi:hypothetical protein